MNIKNKLGYVMIFKCILWISVRPKSKIKTNSQIIGTVGRMGRDDLEAGSSENVVP